MAAINEVKERMQMVGSVGDFVGALQNIAMIKMSMLRDGVLASKRFVDESTEILRELNYYKDVVFAKEYTKAQKYVKSTRQLPAQNELAVLVITSNQGLCGRYNQEVFKKMEAEILLDDNKNADIYVIGKKGQDRYLGKKFAQYKFYPYNLGDSFEFKDIARLVSVFPLYKKIIFVYSRFINAATREVVSTLLVTPPVPNKDKNEMPNVKFLFEPSIDELIRSASTKLHVATFKQQIYDTRLAQYSAQMVGMQTASENAKGILKDLTLEYNKQRRKIIDKKISEVFAGSSTWQK